MGCMPTEAMFVYLLPIHPLSQLGYTGETLKPMGVVGIQKFCKSDQCSNIIFAGSNVRCAATQTGKQTLNN